MVSVAQICQALGWDSVQLSACHLLTDVLQRYLQQLGRGCHRYSELCEYWAGGGTAASSGSQWHLRSSLRYLAVSEVFVFHPYSEIGYFPVPDAPGLPVAPGNSSHPSGASSSSANFPVSALGSTPSRLFSDQKCASVFLILSFLLRVEPPPECLTASFTLVLFLPCPQTTITSCHRRSVYRPFLTRLAILQLLTADSLTALLA